MCWLRVPKGHERAELGDLVERMGDSIMSQVTGRDRSLLGGVVTADDADAASLFDMARNILGNPYEDTTGPVTAPEDVPRRGRRTRRPTGDDRVDRDSGRPSRSTPD